MDLCQFIPIKVLVQRTWCQKPFIAFYNFQTHLTVIVFNVNYMSSTLLMNIDM